MASNSYHRLIAAGLEQLGRALSPSTTPPLVTSVVDPVEKEKRNIRDLMRLLGQTTKGREYLSGLDIEEVGLFDLRLHGEDPSPTELKTLRQSLDKEYGLLKLNDPASKKQR